MLVFAFGASITAQSVHHSSGEPTGYVRYLSDILDKQISNVEVRSLAAGSSHFDGAGYVLLDEVINQKPDFLILDWHSTGLTKFDDFLWASAIRKIRDAAITTLIIIFPLNEVICLGNERPNVSQARGAVGDGIHLLNLYQEVGFSIFPDLHLRDGIHTNAAGGKLYAQLIASAIAQILSDPSCLLQEKGLSVPLVSLDEPVSVDCCLLSNDFMNFSVLDMLIERCSGWQGGISVIAESIVGPFSPVVDISFNDKIAIQSIWDPWCYYPRSNFTNLVRLPCFSKPADILYNITVTTSDKSPEYSQCVKTDFDFSSITERFLRIKKLYCIGAQIKSFAVR
jgi:hypothetical protein